MPKGLKRFHSGGDEHFITCSCYHRQPCLASPRRRDLPQFTPPSVPPLRFKNCSPVTPLVPPFLYYVCHRLAVISGGENEVRCAFSCDTGSGVPFIDAALG